MKIHLVNPSDISFGTAVITPRWLYVLAAATPGEYGDPSIVDETLDPMDFHSIASGDVVGIGIHTFNALRGYEIGREARKRGATVVFGGIHPTLYPEESFELGGAHAVVKGDGDVVWSTVLADCVRGSLLSTYDGGRVSGATFQPARWDLLPADRYMFGSVQTLRGCPKHCSFCSVWRTDGQQPRQRTADAVVKEVVELRRLGFRFILLSDDNFYPVTVEDLRLAERQGNQARLDTLLDIRRERFELMDRLAKLPDDLVFYTQITMEAAEDPEFLKAMNRARIRGALVGVESVTAEGLKSVFKDFNYAGDRLVTRLKEFRTHGVHILGSFIFGLPTDKLDTFDATAELAQKADIAFAQFIMLTPFPGTVDFAKWEEKMASDTTRIAGYPLTRFWLIPRQQRPKVYTPHPSLSPEEIREGTQSTWDRFYSVPAIWERARIVKSLKARLLFLVMSKLYRQMYANTGIATDSARVSRSARWARLLAKQARRLFVTTPMPDLQVPN
ncbi:MAG TPA: radical SAM protein [Vicinamibacterales bacterium]|nr:radical SAM protein [Vicinamibacterales bacterium]